MARQDTIGTTSTTVMGDGDEVRVQYHATVVVRFDRRQIVLDSNGWRTVTTKTRMNQTSNQFNLGFAVYQREYVWYVDYRGKTREFHDGMVLDRQPVRQTPAIRRDIAA